MTLGRNYVLSNENCVTNRAMLAFGKTGVGAGRCYSLINHFGMTLGRNYVLSNKNRITYRAMLTFGETGIRAGCGNSLIDYFGVTECVT